jgi:hypothetical protein
MIYDEIKRFHGSRCPKYCRNIAVWMHTRHISVSLQLRSHLTLPDKQVVWGRSGTRESFSANTSGCLLTITEHRKVALIANISVKKFVTRTVLSLEPVLCFFYMQDTYTRAHLLHGLSITSSIWVMTFLQQIHILRFTDITRILRKEYENIESRLPMIKIQLIMQQIIDFNY